MLKKYISRDKDLWNYKISDIKFNRIYNKIIDRDWFSVSIYNGN